ncbi:hypothetical protein SDC9_155762 [bioreactor metagenome]|uniref:Uncharacterized protein n=1 Tax=bioreactor metagenome TaxID=1076179 RepID=A0A645F3Q6_9ZZZZ
MLVIQQQACEEEKRKHHGGNNIHATVAEVEHHGGADADTEDPSGLSARAAHRKPLRYLILIRLHRHKGIQRIHDHARPGPEYAPADDELCQARCPRRRQLPCDGNDGTERDQAVNRDFLAQAA